MNCTYNPAVYLTNGNEKNDAHPDTFFIPPIEQRLSVSPGAIVKLGFNCDGTDGERMWVTVVQAKGFNYYGVLNNKPLALPMDYGNPIKFGPEHILDIEVFSL